MTHTHLCVYLLYKPIIQKVCTDISDIHFITFVLQTAQNCASIILPLINFECCIFN